MKKPSFLSSSLSFFTLLAVVVTFALVSKNLENVQLLNLFENIVLTLVGAYVGARGLNKSEKTGSKDANTDPEAEVDRVLGTK